MDFNTWAATKKPVTGKTSKDFAWLYGEDSKGFEYEDGYLECQDDGTYYACFGGVECTSKNLEVVEKFLFRNIG